MELTFVEKISGGHIVLSSPMEMYIFGYALLNVPAVWDTIVLPYCSFDTLVSSLTDYAQPGGKVLGTIAELNADQDHLSTSPTFLDLLESVRSLTLQDCDSPGKLSSLLFRALRALL